MSQVLAQVNINAPTDKVWEALVDSGRMTEWLPNSIDLDSFGRLSGNGSSPRYYHYDLVSSVQERATGWEANRSYSYLVGNVGPIKSAHSSFCLEASGTGTLLTQTVNFQMKFGPLGAVMDNLVFRPQFRKQMESSLDALKRFVEGRHRSDAGAEFDYELAA